MLWPWDLRKGLRVQGFGIARLRVQVSASAPVYPCIQFPISCRWDPFFRSRLLGPEGRRRLDDLPRGSIYTTIMELGPKRPSPLWFWGPNPIIVVYVDPLGWSL